MVFVFFFFFQAEDGIRGGTVTGVQTCALPISWRVEADTLPEMAYDHYRHTLIHETSSIKAYLAPRHQERTILVAPKGYGKTLLLIAKKKSFLEARSGQIVMAENRFIDR